MRRISPNTGPAVISCVQGQIKVERGIWEELVRNGVGDCGYRAPKILNSGKVNEIAWIKAMRICRFYRGIEKKDIVWMILLNQTITQTLGINMRSDLRTRTRRS